MPQAPSAIDPLRRQLLSVGFLPDQVQTDFAVPGSGGKAALLAFADHPFDSRTACVAAVVDEEFGDSDLASLRPLGAPVVFQCQPGRIIFWSQGSDRPRFQQRLTIRELPRFFRTHREELSPQAIYRAKLWGRLDSRYQLSFVDAGLMPLVEEEAGHGLTRLVERVVKETKRTLGWGTDIPDRDGCWLIQSTFWLLAAKILQDKGVAGFIRLDLTDVEATYARLAHHYNSDRPKPVRVSSKAKRAALAGAAEVIRQFGHCGCVSTEALAHVYESALIDRETRRKLGTHSTPPWLVDYIVGRLRPWIEELAVEERRVFEPACGHAAFLISAMRTLSELLPGDWPQSRRTYLRRRLRGVEIDAFALEIARLSLTLADVPNPNGWALMPGDMFLHDQLGRGVRDATIVLGNPPFESFGDAKPHADCLPNKAAETFRQVVENLAPGALFGFVLPQTFLHSKQATEVRKKLLRDFEIAEISLFADKVFLYGEPESAVVIGRRTAEPRETSATIRYQWIKEKQVEVFSRTYAPSSATSAKAEAFCSSPTASLRLRELSELWQYLSGAPRLANIAVLGQGLFHKGDRDPTLPANAVKVSPCYQEGLVPGFASWHEDQMTHALPQTSWLNLSPEVIDRRVLGADRGTPQILMNYARVSREAWRLKALIDEEGHPVTSRFSVIRPGDSRLSLSVLWAICNSPVANAYAYCTSSKRDVLVGHMRQLPVPDVRTLDCGALDSAVREYLAAARSVPSAEAVSPKPRAKRPRSRREQPLLFPDEHGSAHGVDIAWLERLRHLHWRIDAEVLRLYDLPAHLERQVLDLFAGVERKGVPFQQTEYFPPDFTELSRLSELLAITDSWPRTNRRRGKLMDLEEKGRLSAKQAQELESLQRLADARVSLLKPTYLEGADGIIDDLKRRGQWIEQQS